jgi:hypothetical protein
MDQEQLDFLTQQKIELILKMKTQKFEEELKGLKEHISNLQTDVMNLRREIANRPVQTAQPARTPDTQNITVTPAREEPKNEEKKTQHPRQGNYTSDDVSIEKFFNYSGK